MCRHRSARARLGALLVVPALVLGCGRSTPGDRPAPREAAVAAPAAFGDAAPATGAPAAPGDAAPPAAPAAPPEVGRAAGGRPSDQRADRPRDRRLPDVTPPSAPAALEALADAGRISLRWSASRDDVGVKEYEVLRDGAPLARSARAEATDATLRVGVTACYAVVAIDAAGNRSPESPPACTVLADTTPPSVPAEVSARPDGESAVSLAWSASTDDVGVARYEILKDGKLVATSTEPRAAVRNLPTAVEACHAVRACDAAANCSAPSPVACATPPDLTPPTVARVYAVVPDSDTRLTVRWKPSTDRVGVVGYAVHRDGQLVAKLPATVTSRQDAGLRPATRYCYTVVAEDAAGNASRPGEPVCATTPDLQPPTVPGNLAAAPRSGSQVVLAWSASTDDVGVAGYEVLRDGQVVAEVDRTQATVALLAPEREYCHAVRALDAAGNRSPPSAAACARTATATAPTAPLDVRARAVSKRELVLSWAPSPDPGVVYVVYWDGNGHGERSIGTTPERSFKVFGKAAEKRHCYRVAAATEAGSESPRTFAVCASAAGGDLADSGTAGAPATTRAAAN
jgi:chitodextrinase